MDLILLTVLGLIAGWLASVVMRTRDSSAFFTDLLLGIAGAIIGGFIMRIVGVTAVSSFDLTSVIIATLGAISLILVGKKLHIAE